VTGDFRDRRESRSAGDPGQADHGVLGVVIGQVDAVDICGLGSCRTIPEQGNRAFVGGHAWSATQRTFDWPIG
jgi:hypothetical protein